MIHLAQYRPITRVSRFACVIVPCLLTLLCGIPSPRAAEQPEFTDTATGFIAPLVSFMLWWDPTYNPYPDLNNRNGRPVITIKKGGAAPVAAESPQPPVTPQPTTPTPESAAQAFLQWITTTGAVESPPSLILISPNLTPVKRASIMQELQSTHVLLRSPHLRQNPPIVLPNTTLIQGDFATLHLAVPSAAIPSSPRVIMLTLAKQGDSWHVCPVLASFEGVPRPYNSDLRASLAQLISQSTDALGVAQAQANALAHERVCTQITAKRQELSKLSANEVSVLAFRAVQGGDYITAAALLDIQDSTTTPPTPLAEGLDKWNALQAILKNYRLSSFYIPPTQQDPTLSDLSTITTGMRGRCLAISFTKDPTTGCVRIALPTNGKVISGKQLTAFAEKDAQHIQSSLARVHAMHPTSGADTPVALAKTLTTAIIRQDFPLLLSTIPQASLQEPGAFDALFTTFLTKCQRDVLSVMRLFIIMESGGMSSSNSDTVSAFAPPPANTAIDPSSTVSVTLLPDTDENSMQAEIALNAIARKGFADALLRLKFIQIDGKWFLSPTPQE